MGLRIALYIANRVPVAKYGGTERDVVWLARELTRQGHHVTLLAPPGSYVPGVRMVFVPVGKAPEPFLPRDVQFVNYHSKPGPQPFARSLLSIHGNIVGSPRTDVNLNFISADHAARHGHKTFVYNGFPVDEHYFSDAKSERYLFFAAVAAPRMPGGIRP